MRILRRTALESTPTRDDVIGETLGLSSDNQSSIYSDLSRCLYPLPSAESYRCICCCQFLRGCRLEVILLSAHELSVSTSFEREEERSVSDVEGILVLIVSPTYLLDSEERSSELTHPTLYPHNLTLKNLYYFIFAPTLCYESNFPYSSTRRKGFLLRRVGEILVLLSLQFCLGQQWIFPILSTLDRPLNHYSALENIERLLRLALPNHLLWLSFFYVYFHSILNLLAEVLGFSDRLFYRDWWNATDLYEFWNRWNTSVHDFCKRHIYKPLVIQCGVNKFIGSFVVFAISAFFHEVSTSC